MQRLQKQMLRWRNRTTIQKQLSLIVALAVTLTMALLIMFNYASHAQTNAERQVSMLRRVLALESSNMDKYISELRSFSIQLRNNASFMELAASNSPLSYTQGQTIESALKVNFYSRNDIQRLELFLVRPNVQYTLARNSRKIAVTSGVNISLLPDYELFTAKPDFFSIRPYGDGFAEITRTIIDSPRETPLAVVRFFVDLDMVSVLSASHSQEEESLCIFGEGGEVYYASRPLTPEDTDTLRAFITAEASDEVLSIGGKEALCVSPGIGAYGFTLVGFKPMSLVNAPLIATRNVSIVLGMVLLVLTVLLVVYCIRFVTKPLSQLAHRLRRVGTGNFTTKAELDGSAELIGLSEDVNHMMEDIHWLIERSYVAKLNERTAQLIALEAQINPHFLFNTLQAIATQAIVQKQDDIYRMVTALASLLRYSIKGGNLSLLETELDHVEKYLSLQKARFGDRLTYDLRTDAQLMLLTVPKLGVLSLVENSITHGLTGAVDTIRIEVEAEIVGKDAVFRVRDNGYGIPVQKLQELRKALLAPPVLTTQNIGLMNLASRLKLLYEDKARLEINSDFDLSRQTVVTITIPLEVLRNVQDFAD